MRKVLAAVPIIFAALAVYAGTADFGLFSDDFNWLVGAQLFDPGSLFDLSYRTHFFRPVVEVYFPAALTICGKSAECYHWLNIALHAGTGLLAGAVAGSVSKNQVIGILAGVLFVVMPGPAEAIVWVACVPEILAALLFVLTLWLFRRAVATGDLWSYVVSMLSFALCLMTHESGVTLLPVLMLSIWLLPPDGLATQPIGKMIRMLAPLAIMLTAYLVVEYIINSRNYLVTEGAYGVGAHILSNALGAFATLAVTRHDTGWLIVVGALALWALIAAPPRIRFYLLFTFITLAPVVGFRGGLAGRYLYLPAIGFAALTAELLWSARESLRRWPRAGMAVWWIVTIALTVRFANFAVKNAHVWESASAPFTAYAQRVREIHPAPARGATLDVPPPPDQVLPQYLPSLLQWEYNDPALKPVVRDR